MNNKITTFLILVIFSLFLFNSASSILGYLRPAIMKIRLNTTDIVERSLTIKNVNNISIFVNASINGNISEVITIKNPTFEVLTNETKTMDFIVKTDKPGVYSGQIIVTYNNEPIQLTSDITVIASENPNPGSDIPVMPILVVIIISAIIVSIIWLKRGRGR